MRHRKRKPNRSSFLPLTIPQYAGLTELQQLILSRLKGGAIWNQEKEYTTTTGRVLTLQPGDVWCSIKTICEDIEAATGMVFARHKVKYALDKLDRFFANRKVAFPETRGRYGIIFSLTKEALDMSGHLYDPIKEHRVLVNEDPRRYRLGISAWINDQGYFNMGDVNRAGSWIRVNAEEGNENAAFTTIGRWCREGDVRRAECPVYVPWLIMDIDRHDDLLRAYEDTQTVLGDIESYGFDMARVFVSFSGSKGFNIAISTDQFGSPIFENSDAAREICGDLQMDITDVETDPHTYSALNMIRLTGSRHEKTGFYKRTWNAQRFSTFSFADIYRDRDEFQPFRFPDPTAGDSIDVVRAEFLRLAKANAAKAVKRMSGAKRGADKSLPPALRNIVNGVQEGQKWSKYRSGRDWAAFTLACYILDSLEQCQLVVDALKETLPIDPDPKFPLSVLQAWNEDRCYPPMKERKLNAKFQSAVKKINGVKDESKKPSKAGTRQV